MDAVPPLVVNPAGRGLRAIGLVARGVRRVSRQVEPYTEWWSEQNQQALIEEGPLWISVGDSTCLGIGASDPMSGWVGRVIERLRSDDPSWRVINLAMSGARISDALTTHLPVVEQLVAAGHRPTLTTACVGTNDVLWERIHVTDLRDQVETLASKLPRPVVIATIAGSSSRVALTNRVLKQAATDRSVELVDPWREPGPGILERIADDRFHPNDIGHELMSEAFLRAIAVVLGGSDDNPSFPSPPSDRRGRTDE